MALTLAPTSTFTDTGSRYPHVDTYPDYPYTIYNPYDNPTTVFNNSETTAMIIWIVSVG